MAIIMRLSRMKKRRPIGRRFSHFQGDSLEERSLRSLRAYLFCLAKRNPTSTVSRMGFESEPPDRAGSKRMPGMTFRTAVVSSGFGEACTDNVEITGRPSVSTVKRTRTSPSTSEI